VTKEEVIKELLNQDLTDAVWHKSFLSGSTGQDCLEVAKLDGGWMLRSSVLPDHMIPLTDSEYEAYIGGIKANQPGLVPET
jgi:hypothetical protein